MLNKGRLFDHGLKQSTTDSDVKMMRCMVDYGLKMEKTLKELRALLQPTGVQPELVGTPGAGPCTTPASTSSPKFVIPLATQPDLLLQEPIPVLNTEEMASLQNWAETGPEALTTPTTGTGLNPVNLSTPGSASQEDQRRHEERTKRKAEEAESKSSSFEEEEEESPISSTRMKRSTKVLIPPLIRANRKRPRIKSTGPLPDRRPKRSPLAPNARQPRSRSKVVAVGLTKGEEVRSA